MKVSRGTPWARFTAGLLPFFLVAALLPASSLASAPRSAQSLPRQAGSKAEASEAVRQTDRVLVRWSTRLSRTAAGAPGRLATLESVTGREPTLVRVSGSGAAIYDLGAPLGLEAGPILAALGAAEGVASVEPDLWMTADTLPSDPRASELWGLLGATDGSPYGIDAPGAWATSTGAGVVVAVIDTGLVTHEDLAGQAVAGYDMISNTFTANDGDGREADASDPGDSCGARPSTWHGTHVAGTIAALLNNGVGVFGGAPGVKIQPVRVLGTCGGYSSDVADGIRWAAGGSVPGVPANATPARVLNLSLGGSSPSCTAEYSAAIADARSRGAVIVVAAGNSAIDASQFSPANCNGVITVAATDQAGKRASFSNYGPAVELSGPGVSIVSTVDSGTTVPIGPTYATYNGTSMATPHVVVAAALLAAAAPTLTPGQIEAILAETSTPFGADTSPTGCPTRGCGAGIVHAARAVTIDTTSPIGSVSINGGGAATSSTAVSVAVPASDAWGVSRVRLSNDSGMAGAVDRAYTTPQSWTLAAGADGARTVYVQWRDSFGNWSGVGSDSITLDTTAPAGSVSINGDAGTTSNSAVMVAVPASDDSGVNQVRLSNDPAMADAVNRAYGTPQSWSVAAGPDGTRTVYVQWQDSAGNWSGVSTDSISLDATGPTGSVSIDADAATTTGTAVSLAVPASDASGVGQIRLSNDPTMTGAVDRAYSATQSWTLALGPDGPRTVYVQWQDSWGNWSAIGSDSIAFDATAPVGSAPTASLTNGAALDKTTVPVRLAWSGSDAGSGLDRFELAMSRNGGAYAPLVLPSPTATTLTPLLNPGSASYQFRLRSIDVAGNASAWAAGPILHVRRVQETSLAIRYTGTWSRGSATAALAGRYRHTARARASVTYTFAGRSIAWVANRGTSLGWARVYIDGKDQGRVNLRAPSSLWRRVVFSRTFATSGRHTIRIVGSGTRGHPRVSLDAFVVLQ